MDDRRDQASLLGEACVAGKFNDGTAGQGDLSPPPGVRLAQGGSMIDGDECRTFHMGRILQLSPPPVERGCAVAFDTTELANG